MLRNIPMQKVHTKMLLRESILLERLSHATRMLPLRELRKSERREKRTNKRKRMTHRGTNQKSTKTNLPLNPIFQEKNVKEEEESIDAIDPPEKVAKGRKVDLEEKEAVAEDLSTRAQVKINHLFVDRGLLGETNPNETTRDLARWKNHRESDQIDHPENQRPSKQLR